MNDITIYNYLQQINIRTSLISTQQLFTRTNDWDSLQWRFQCHGYNVLWSYRAAKLNSTSWGFCVWLVVGVCGPTEFFWRVCPRKFTLSNPFLHLLGLNFFFNDRFVLLTLSTKFLNICLCPSQWSVWPRTSHYQHSSQDHEPRLAIFLPFCYTLNLS